MEHICTAGKGMKRIHSMSKHSVFCWTVSPWFLQCLTTDTFRLYNQLLPMLPIWAGWEIPIRLEVYSAPTRKLHQLTNNLITYHLSQYPNQTLGLVPSCAFGDFKVTKTKMLGIECMKCLVYQTNKKKYHYVVCILNDFWDFPGDSGIRNRPANAGDEGSMPGPGNSHMLWSHWAPEPQLFSQ